jgi:tripartite ATP-independent transporter DctM subunit
LLVLHPAFDFAVEEAMVTTPSLEISNAWRVSALPVGLGLMALLAAIRLIKMVDRRQMLLAVGIVVVTCAVFGALSPVLRTLGNLNLLLFFVGVTLVTVLIGVPIAVSFGLATFGFLALTTSTPVGVVVGRMDEGMSHIILLAVPLFVFLGLLIEMTGMARAMVAFLASLLGHVRGGLSYVLLGAMYLVSGISGSKVADMAAVAPVLFPEMRKRGAKDGDLVALLSTTGAQTETIPPSLVLITIGSVTGVSIAALFTGGMLPGLVLAATLCVVVWFRYRNEDLSHVQRATAPEIGRAFMIALPAVLLPFVIRAAVVEGVATATEVSTLGIAYSIVAGVVFYRRMEWKRMLPMLVETAALSGAILFIIGTATGMAWALTQSGLLEHAGQGHGRTARRTGGLPGGVDRRLHHPRQRARRHSAIVLFGPLMFPIAKQIGVHEVHYAMVVVLAMGIGLFAPPFGVGYYAACAVGRVDPAEGMRPIVGYVVALIVGWPSWPPFPGFPSVPEGLSHHGTTDHFGRFGAAQIARFLKSRGVDRMFGLCGGPHHADVELKVDAAGIRIVERAGRTRRGLHGPCARRDDRRTGRGDGHRGAGRHERDDRIANAHVARCAGAGAVGHAAAAPGDGAPCRTMAHTEFVRPLTRYARTVRQPELVLQELDEAVSRASARAASPDRCTSTSRSTCCAATCRVRCSCPSCSQPRPRRRMLPDPEAVQRGGRAAVVGAAAALHLRARRARRRAALVRLLDRVNGAVPRHGESRGLVPEDHRRSWPRCAAR